MARASRPDALSGSTAYLIRQTYQIRLQTFMAQEQGMRLGWPITFQ